MSLEELPADTPADVRAGIAAARSAQAAAVAELGQIQTTRRQLAPVFARLRITAVPDSFGAELETALTPRRNYGGRNPWTH